MLISSGANKLNQHYCRAQVSVRLQHRIQAPPVPIITTVAPDYSSCFVECCLQPTIIESDSREDEIEKSHVDEDDVWKAVRMMKPAYTPTRIAVVATTEGTPWLGGIYVCFFLTSVHMCGLL